MVVQYAAVRQILYIFCAYRLLVEEYRHGRQRPYYAKLVP